MHMNLTNVGADDSQAVKTGPDGFRSPAVSAGGVTSQPQIEKTERWKDRQNKEMCVIIG